MLKGFFEALRRLFAGAESGGTAGDSSAAPQNDSPGEVKAFPPPITQGGHAAAGLKGSDIDTLARTLWGEARGEGRRGMHAAANVIMRRHALRRSGRGYSSFGPLQATVAQICRQPWQFSCWNKNDPNLPQLLAVDARDSAFREAVDIAARAVAGTLDDLTNGADHYHTRNAHPAWSRDKKPVAEIGTHRFFRLAY